jgi:hypothetical protein
MRERGKKILQFEYLSAFLNMHIEREKEEENWRVNLHIENDLMMNCLLFFMIVLINAIEK